MCVTKKQKSLVFMTLHTVSAMKVTFTKITKTKTSRIVSH